jgi:hypothetical protein
MVVRRITIFSEKVPRLPWLRHTSTLYYLAASSASTRPSLFSGSQATGEWQGG